MIRTIRVALLAVAMLGITGAACTPAPSDGTTTTPASVTDEISLRLNQAEITASASKRLATTLVTNNTITADRAQQISDAADVVFSAVTTGRSLVAAGNATGAQAQISGVSSALRDLTTFYLNSTGGH